VLDGCGAACGCVFSSFLPFSPFSETDPLAKVITELDGLKRNTTALGFAAVEVVDYLESAVRSHSRYLKIQTSRGNYLKDLSIRNESIDFGSSPSSPFDLPSSTLDPSSSSHDFAHSMDDVILRAVTWQSQHFTSRLALVNPRAVRAGLKVPAETATVVLVTFDRNLRLKARARGLEATDEKGLKRAVEVGAGVVSAAAAG
jgi:protein SMG6